MPKYVSFLNKNCEQQSAGEDYDVWRSGPYNEEEKLSECDLSITWSCKKNKSEFTENNKTEDEKIINHNLSEKTYKWGY